jgi:hypothetical protein
MASDSQESLTGESLKPHGGRGLYLQPRGGRPQLPKYFQTPKWPLKLYFLTNNDYTKCSINCTLAYRLFSSSKTIIIFILKRQRKRPSHQPRLIA